jgi:hypothetical protein
MEDNPHEKIVGDMGKFIDSFTPVTINNEPPHSKKGKTQLRILHMLLDIINNIYMKHTISTRSSKKRKATVTLIDPDVTAERSHPAESISEVLMSIIKLIYSNFPSIKQCIAALVINDIKVSPYKILHVLDRYVISHSTYSHLAAEINSNIFKEKAGKYDRKYNVVPTSYSVGESRKTMVAVASGRWGCIREESDIRHISLKKVLVDLVHRRPDKFIYTDINGISTVKCIFSADGCVSGHITMNCGGIRVWKSQHLGECFCLSLSENPDNFSNTLKALGPITNEVLELRRDGINVENQHYPVDIPAAADKKQLEYLHGPK